jgi:glutamate-1-semialdehyde aminotransferase
MIAPIGLVYHADTLSKNPVVEAARLETLRLLKASGLTKDWKNLK